MNVGYSEFVLESERFLRTKDLLSDLPKGLERCIADAFCPESYEFLEKNHANPQFQPTNRNRKDEKGKLMLRSDILENNNNLDHDISQPNCSQRSSSEPQGISTEEKPKNPEDPLKNLPSPRPGFTNEVSGRIEVDDFLVRPSEDFKVEISIKRKNPWARKDSYPDDRNPLLRLSKETVEYIAYPPLRDLVKAKSNSEPQPATGREDVPLFTSPFYPLSSEDDEHTRGFVVQVLYREQ